VAGVLSLAAFLGIAMVIGYVSEFTSPADGATASTSRVRPPTAPTIAGWRPVVSDDHPSAFDVPEDWTVEGPGVIVGFEAPDGELLALHGVGRFRSNFCQS
jgi:hypothetical protein